MTAHIIYFKTSLKKKKKQYFPDGLVVKNPTANTGDGRLNPAPRKSLHAMEHLSLSARAIEPEL